MEANEKHITKKMANKEKEILNVVVEKLIITHTTVYESMYKINILRHSQLKRNIQQVHEEEAKIHLKKLEAKIHLTKLEKFKKDDKIVSFNTQLQKENY